MMEVPVGNWDQLREKVDFEMTSSGLPSATKLKAFTVRLQVSSKTDLVCTRLFDSRQSSSCEITVQARVSWKSLRRTSDWEDCDTSGLNGVRKGVSISDMQSGKARSEICWVAWRNSDICKRVWRSYGDFRVTAWCCVLQSGMELEEFESDAGLLIWYLVSAFEVKQWSEPLELLAPYFWCQVLSLFSAEFCLSRKIFTSTTTFLDYSIFLLK